MIINILLLWFSVLSNDSNSFENKIQQAKSVMSDSVELAIVYAQEAEELATTKKELGRVYWMLGSLYDWNNQPINASNYYYGAARIYDKLRDDNNTARLYENIGTVALNNHVPKTALRAYEKGLKHAERHGDYQLIARMRLDMGLAHKLEGNHDESLQWYMSAYHVIRVEGNAKDDAGMYSKIFNELGLLYTLIAEESPTYSDTAAAHFEEAMRWADSDVNKYKPLNNAGYLLMKQAQYDTALSTFKCALKVGEGIGSGSLVIPTLNNMGVLHYLTGDYNRADSMLMLAIRHNIKDRNYLDNRIDRLLSVQVYSSVELARSYEYLDYIHAVKDSTLVAGFAAKVRQVLYNQDRLEAVTAQQMIELEHERIMQDIASRERDQRIYTWVKLGGLLLIIVALSAVLVWYVRRVRAKKRAIEQTIQELNGKYPMI